MAEKSSSFSSLWERHGHDDCWAGVQMRSIEVESSSDEAEALRKVVFPAVWPDSAGLDLELLANAPAGTVRLKSESAWWLNLMCPPSEDPALKGLGNGLVGLLLLRQMMPSQSLWERDLSVPPAFVLRLSAFVEEGIFQANHFLACLEMAAKGLKKALGGRSASSAPMLPIFADFADFEGAEGVSEKDSLTKQGALTETQQNNVSFFLLSDLDAALGEMGLEYDSDAGRESAQGIVFLASLAALAGEGRFSELEKYESKFPLEAPSEMRHAAFEFCTRLSQKIQGRQGESPLSSREDIVFKIGFSSPNPVDSLLGVEACGLAPIFSPLDENGKIKRSFVSRLARQGLTAEKALALMLSGEKILSMPGNEAHLKMREAIKKTGAILPEIPDFDICGVKANLERGVRRFVPARKKGVSERVVLDNRDLFFRVGEFEDGSPAELELHMVRESPLARGLMECFSQAVSLGLQYGVPLEAYVDQFKHTHFPPSGAVEGGRNIHHATSLLDYIFRSLAELYLGKTIPDHEETAGTASLSRQRKNSSESLTLPFKDLNLTGTGG